MSSLSDHEGLGKLCRFCLNMFDLTDGPWPRKTSFVYHQNLPSLLVSIEENCSFCTRMLQLLPGRDECSNSETQWKRLNIDFCLLDFRASPPFKGTIGKFNKEILVPQSVAQNDFEISNHIRGGLSLYGDQVRTRLQYIPWMLSTVPSSQGWTDISPPILINY
jgi:hypothetical protein